VDKTAIRAAIETADADANVPGSLPRADGARTERIGCFHCGEPCADSSFVSGEKTFCCNGCLVVHDLLTENGLEQFYALNDHPGARVRHARRSEQWAFLDEPALQRRLLDFTDGTTSRVTFHVPAIHCVACVWLLENLFRLHPGVARSQVNFPRREVAIQFNSGTGVPPVRVNEAERPEPETHRRDARATIKLSELVALLASIGYEPTLTLNELETRKTDPAIKRRWIQLGLAGFAFGNIMLFSLPRYLGLDSFSGALFERLFGWLSLVLAAPVVIYSASDYWKSALLSLRQRVLTLDVPIALGLAAIYGQSAFEILMNRGEGYCDSLTGLIFFLLCGRAFQQKTHERIAFDRDYKSFFPLSVTRRSSRREEAHSQTPNDQSLLTSAATNGAEEQISLSQLQVGDRIILRNGELIPADATLASGAALIDYSFVTGESEPVSKNAGDYLYAGGKQIGGAIEIETVKRVSQSYLMSLWNHETFQKDRDSNLGSLTNRYSRRFTLIVIAVAIGAALFWMATGNLPRGIKAFTSVLIVACPCALALAAPFTLGTAQRLLARLNVFVKNALVLERMARVDAIVFDKTGTLTAAGGNSTSFHRAPENRSSRREEALTKKIETEVSLLTSAATEMGLSAKEETLVRSLARHSTHPYSRRISEALGNGRALLAVDSFVETPGFGIEGEIDGHLVRLGSQQWIETQSAVDLGAPASRRRDGQKHAGGTPALPGVHLAIDGHHRGVFTVANEIRADIDRLLQRLSANYKLVLLSGDSEKERELFWNLFGSDEAMHFNQSPLDKLNFIRRLQQSGGTVMMVGDGLNDAGALKQSDVGVAVVEKVGAFSPASDAILESSRVPQLFEILQFACKSTRIVRICFAISAAYNLVGVGIAAAGILSPMVCAVLMPVSSITVVLFAISMTTWAGRKLRVEELRVESSTNSHSQLSTFNSQLFPKEA